MVVWRASVRRCLELLDAREDLGALQFGRQAEILFENVVVQLKQNATVNLVLAEPDGAVHKNTKHRRR